MSVTQFENERWSNEKQKAVFRHRVALDLVSSGPVLDIGCGDGLFLSMLHEKGYEVEGVDLSPVAVTAVEAKGLKASVCDFTETKLPYEDKHFGTVVALDVLEHVYDPSFVLAEMVRVARDAVVISVPNFSSFPARIQVVFGKVPENNQPNKGHVYWFNWTMLQGLTSGAGLRITKVQTNALRERIPFIGTISKLLATLFPNLFALSFVVRCEFI